MYTTFISPKVYTRETDLTYRTPKIRDEKKKSKPSDNLKPPVETFYLLLENGFYLLTENNYNISIK